MKMMPPEVFEAVLQIAEICTDGNLPAALVLTLGTMPLHDPGIPARYQQAIELARAIRVYKDWRDNDPNT